VNAKDKEALSLVISARLILLEASAVLAMAQPGNRDKSSIFLEPFFTKYNLSQSKHV